MNDREEWRERARDIRATSAMMMMMIIIIIINPGHGYIFILFGLFKDFLVYA